MFADKPSSPPFAPLRRVITGHTSEGKSVVVEDAPVLPHTLDGATNETYFTDLFWSDEFPSENDIEFKNLTKEHEKDFFSENESSLRLLEFSPGGAPSVSLFIHFKDPNNFRCWNNYSHSIGLSLDYGIALSGSLTLILDDDKRTVLNAGDVIVRRGTTHG